MRWSVLLCSAAGAAVGASQAQAEGPYVGLQGGLYKQQPVAYNFVGLSNFFNTKYAKGFDAGVKAGYDFEGIRLEAAINYKRAKTNYFGFAIDGEPLAVQRGKAVTGNLNTVTAMVNGYWDISQKRVSPFVGAGIGIARVASDRVGYSGLGDIGIFLDSSNVAFAFNVMGGVKARITRRLSANVEYKYSGVENFKLHVFNTSAGSTLRSSAVLAGVSFAFGHSIRDTPPPPRPPVAPPPPEETRQEAEAPLPTTFSLSFATGSAALNEDAAITLDQIAAAYQRAGRASVMVLNLQAGTGLAPYDEPLADRRAAAVRDNLIRRGVPAQGITVQKLDAPHTSPGTAPPLPERFVQITFGPGSGQ